MKEYIEREALALEVLGLTIVDPAVVQYANAVLSRIQNAPAADVVERKRGEWVLGHVEHGYCTPGGNRPWICSECWQVKSWRMDKPNAKFCDECGADMREVDHDQS